jgi:thiol-disulfide isomerase/thioredoxin
MKLLLKSLIFCSLGLIFQIHTFAQDFKIQFTSKGLAFKSPGAWDYKDYLTDDWHSFSCRQTVNLYQCKISVGHPQIISLINTTLLAIPAQTIEGTFNTEGTVFKISDSNNINRLIIGFEDQCQHLIQRYNTNTTFDQFLKVADSLQILVERTLKHIDIPIIKSQFKITAEIESAFKELCLAELANYYVLPILYKTNYQYSQIKDLINKDIEISDPNYWLQSQAGRVFLRTFFTKLLAETKGENELKLIGQQKLFKDTRIQKYTLYQYFMGLINDQKDPVDAVTILKNFNHFEQSYSFSVSELKSLHDLKTKLNLLNRNIMLLFQKEPLSDYAGNLLGKEKDSLLSMSGKVILYYWASWCAPCRATINKLKSDETEYKGEHYKIIFISIDDTRKSWRKVQYKVLNANNSFLISNLPQDPFYYFFKIWQEVPRLFLIDKKILINENFSREEFYKIFKL